MRKLLAFGILVLAFGVLATAGDRSRRPKWFKKAPGAGEKRGAPIKSLEKPRQISTTRGLGFIQYDSGNVNAVGSTFEFVYGNRFNSNSGVPINANAHLTQLQFYLTQVSGTFAWVSFFGPPVGTTAPVIQANPYFSVQVGMNTVAASVDPGSDFLGGVLNFYSAGNPSGHAVGLDAGGTFGGQGFHGMMIHSTLTPTGYATLPNTNGVFRVFGTSVPVELMGFEVTD